MPYQLIDHGNDVIAVSVLVLNPTDTYLEGIMMLHVYVFMSLNQCSNAKIFLHLIKRRTRVMC